MTDTDTSTDTGTDHPNVLVVLTDQQRWDTVGAYGSAMDLTPNLDAMADRGTRLDRCFSSNPVCGPQRASLQTGQYPTEVGVHRNLTDGTGDSPIRRVETTLADAFAGAGYRTGYVGKWHLADTRRDPVPEHLRGGYRDYWVAADALEHTAHAYEGTLFDGDGNPVEFADRYRVDAVTDYAEEFVRDAAGRDDPFFLFASILEPHHQNDRDTFVAPDGYAEEHANPWVPPDLRERPGDWFEELPDYYGCIERIDECLGRLLGALEDEGVRDDTVVLFTSDHGCHFRTRNREYKRSCHESSIRVPAVLSGPGFDGGGVVRSPVSLLDVPPTLLDAAGLDAPDAMQGESVRPVVDGERDGREDVLVQVSESAVERTLRTDRWTYSVYDPEADPVDDPASDRYVERYLYDLRADPHQRVNLVGRPDHRDVADRLADRLAKRIAEYEGREVDIDAARYPA